MNEERRMFGLARDDDLRKDAEALFGRSIQAPIDIGDDKKVGMQKKEAENSCKYHLSTLADVLSTDSA